MSESATTPEQVFRVMYAAELKKKRDNELQDERRRVNYQEGKTPGRRGEMIMQDEISKETIRRYYLDRKGSTWIRIYASIHTSRENQCLEDMNNYRHAIEGSVNLLAHQIFLRALNNRDTITLGWSNI